MTIKRAEAITAAATENGWAVQVQKPTRSVRRLTLRYSLESRQ